MGRKRLPLHGTAASVLRVGGKRFKVGGGYTSHVIYWRLDMFSVLLRLILAVCTD